MLQKYELKGSRLDNFGIWKLLTNAADPITRRIFAILDPTIFPKDNSLAFLRQHLLKQIIHIMTFQNQ